MIMHYVGLALVNSWILYQQEAKVLKLPRKKVYKFLAFKLNVAQTYLAAANDKAMQTHLKLRPNGLTSGQ